MLILSFPHGISHIAGSSMGIVRTHAEWYAGMQIAVARQPASNLQNLSIPGYTTYEAWVPSSFA